MVDLAPGKYEYKFVVDGEWRCCNLQTITKDNLGNENNCLEVSASLSAPLARVATPSLPLLCFPPVLPLCSQLDTQCWCTLALRTSPLRACMRTRTRRASCMLSATRGLLVVIGPSQGEECYSVTNGCSG